MGNMRLLARLVFMYTVCAILIGKVPAAHAQDLGLAQQLPIQGNGVITGSIISYSNSTFHLSTEPYDKDMFGVVSALPALVLTGPADGGTYSVIKTGIINVRVNGENGPIKKGDAITSSSTPGVAMKFVKSGYVLGVSKEDFSGSGEGLVNTSIDIKFSFAISAPPSERIAQRLTDVVKLSSIALFEQPSQVFRYVVAAIIILGTIVFSFFSFGRVAHKGTEAIGRNPLASKQILVGIVLNVLICVAILAAGLGTAYMVIRV